MLSLSPEKVYVVDSSSLILDIDSRRRDDEPTRSSREQRYSRDYYSEYHKDDSVKQENGGMLKSSRSSNADSETKVELVAIIICIPSSATLMRGMHLVCVSRSERKMNLRGREAISNGTGEWKIPLKLVGTLESRTHSYMSLM